MKHSRSSPGTITVDPIQHKKELLQLATDNASILLQTLINTEIATSFLIQLSPIHIIKLSEESHGTLRARLNQHRHFVGLLNVA